MSPLLKNLVIVLGVVLFAGIIYIVAKPGESIEEGAFSLSESDAVKQIAKTLADTKKIDTFKLEGVVLEDARFKALKEVEITLTDTGTGRSNPFESVQ